MPPEQPQNSQPGADQADQPAPPPPASVITPSASPAGIENPQPTAPSISAPAQPQAPNTAPQPNPAQPAGPVISSSSASNPGQPQVMKPKRRGPLLLLILLVVLILAAAGAYFLLKKPAAKPATPASKTGQTQGVNMTVKVPSDWQKLDTGLGFSISVPAGWTAGTSATGDINNLNSANVSLSANAATPITSTPQTDSTSNGGTASTDASQAQISSQVLEASSEKLDNGNSEAAFKKKVSQLGSDDAASLKALGIDTSKVTINSKSIKINGKPWTQVTTNIPSQYSETLYYWDKDHAIALTGVDTTQAKVQQLLKNYLLPMAASLTINKTSTSQSVSQ